jgi:PKD repeat protein
MDEKSQKEQKSENKQGSNGNNGSITKKKFRSITWVVVIIVVIVFTAALIGFFYYSNNNGEPSSDKNQTSIGLDHFFNSIEVSISDHLGIQFLITDDPAAQQVLALAYKRGFTQPGKIFTIENARGVKKTFTVLNAVDSKQAVFVYTDGFGQSKAVIQEYDVEANTLTTYNDAESGITTDLTTGEVIKSWGPLTHHSDLYNYNVRNAKRNYFIWQIGLKGNLAQTAFEFACGHILPENLLETTISAFEDPTGLLADHVGCVTHLALINRDANEAIADQSIVNYLPDISYDEIPFTYEYGKLTVNLINDGKGYTGPFEVALFGKIGEGEWTYIESKRVDTIRPKNSNNIFPGQTEVSLNFTYETHENEILLVKFDPADIVEESRENNNQKVLGRDILNQTPQAFAEIIYPNPGIAGQVVAFGGDALDVDGHIGLRGYEWDFGNGTKWRTEDIIHYTYTDPGTYTVRLRVLDNDGTWSNWVSQQLVINPSLHAAKEPYQGYMPIVTAFDAPDYAQSVAWDGSNLWTTDAEKLYKINSKNGAIEGEFDLPFDTEAIYDWETLDEIVIDMTWDGSNFWLIYRPENKIYKIDQQANLIATFDSPGADPTAITWTGTNPIVKTKDGFVKIDSQDGSLLEIIESADRVTGMAWSGGNLWTTDQNKILKYSSDFILQDNYPPPGSRTSYQVPYVRYPFRPLDMAWDGKYLWVLSDRDRKNDQRPDWKDKWPPILYRCDPNGAPASYIIIPELGDLGTDGVVWDGDGILVPVNEDEAVWNSIEKISLAGEYMFTVASHQSVFPGVDRWRNFHDLAYNGQEFWLLSDHYGDDILVTLDQNGQAAQKITPDISGSTSMTFDQAGNLWLGGKYHLRKFNTNTQEVTKYEYHTCTKSIMWINNDLWCIDKNGRIIKMEYNNNEFSQTEIYTPAYPIITAEEKAFSECMEPCYEMYGHDITAQIFECARECEENTGYVLTLDKRGGGLGWDGQNIWGIFDGHIFQLDYIPVSPEYRSQTPYFTHEAVISETPEGTAPEEEPIEEESATAGWNSYQSDYYSFSFMYPPTWNLTERDYNPETNPDSQVTSGLLLELYFDKPKTTFVEIWREHASIDKIEYEKNFGTDSSLQQTNFSNYEWRELEIRCMPNQISGDTQKSRIYTYEKNEKYKYVVKSDYCDNDKATECDLLMESFEFVE